MPHVDQIVIACLALGLLGCAAFAWRAGARRGRFAALLFAAFYGWTLVVMLAAHCADVTYASVLHTPSFGDQRPMTYDWRTYSLLLFGAILIRQGVRSMAAARAMARGDDAARGEALRATGLVLALVLPLIPVHAFFGWLISGASALTLLVVGLAGRGAVRAPATELAPSAA
jgi:hypothetical protein